MLTAYSKVTIINGSRRVDLALPSALPVADVVLQVLRLCTPEQHSDRPAAWTLARLGGTGLGLSQTLHDAGVLDGEVLELRHVGMDTRPAYVEDVRDALEDVVDAAGGSWTSQTTLAFSLAAAAVTLAVAAAWPVLRDADTSLGLVSALVAVTVLVAGVWFADRATPVWTTLVVVPCAAVWGAAAGWLGAGLAGWSTSARLAAAGLVALSVAAGCRAITAAAAPYISASVVLTIPVLAVAIVDLQGVDPQQVVRASALVAVLAVGILPRISLAAGGLASADYRVRQAGRMTREALARRITESTALLQGAVLATSLVAGASGATLAFGSSNWDRLVALLLGLLLLLRSRVFSQVLQIVPLRVAGTVVLTATLARLAGDVPHLGDWLVVIGVIGAAAVVAVSAIRLTDIPRARAKRLLNASEFIATLGLVVATAGALGLFDRFGQAGG